MKYSSRNSPVENSVDNSNQIHVMSIACREYNTKIFIYVSGKIAVKSFLNENF